MSRYRWTGFSGFIYQRQLFFHGNFSFTKRETAPNEIIMFCSAKIADNTISLGNFKSLYYNTVRIHQYNRDL